MKLSHPQSHVTHRSCGRVANQERYLSSFTRPMALNHDEGTPPKESRYNLILQLHGNLKTSYLLNYRAYGPQTLQDADYSVVITIEA